MPFYNSEIDSRMLIIHLTLGQILMLNSVHLAWMLIQGFSKYSHYLILLQRALGLWGTQPAHSGLGFKARKKMAKTQDPYPHPLKEKADCRQGPCSPPHNPGALHQSSVLGQKARHIRGCPHSTIMVKAPCQDRIPSPKLQHQCLTASRYQKRGGCWVSQVRRPHPVPQLNSQLWLLTCFLLLLEIHRRQRWIKWLDADCSAGSQPDPVPAIVDI